MRAHGQDELPLRTEAGKEWGPCGAGRIAGTGMDGRVMIGDRKMHRMGDGQDTEYWGSCRVTSPLRKLRSAPVIKRQGDTSSGIATALE